MIHPLSIIFINDLGDFMSRKMTMLICFVDDINIFVRPSSFEAISLLATEMFDRFQLWILKHKLKNNIDTTTSNC